MGFPAYQLTATQYHEQQASVRVTGEISNLFEMLRAVRRRVCSRPTLIQNLYIKCSEKPVKNRDL